MDFSFDDEQQLFKRSARKFLETYCDKSVVEELETSESGFSPALWKGMAELGWMGVPLPSEYGGLESVYAEVPAYNVVVIAAPAAMNADHAQLLGESVIICGH